MSSPNNSFRRAALLISIVVVMTLLLGSISGFIYFRQQQQLTSSLIQDLETEADLIGGIIRDALLRRDYAEARSLLESWPATHRNVVLLEVVLGNGKKLFSYRSPKPFDENFITRRVFTYGDRGLTVSLCHRSDNIRKTLDELAGYLAVAGLFLVVVIGLILWFILFRWIVKPMEWEIKLRTQELRTSEERFRRLAENAQDMIYRMALPDGRYEYVSPAAATLTGYDPEEFYATPLIIRTLIHPEFHDYFEIHWKRLLHGDMPPCYEYKVVHRSHATRWLHQRNTLVRGEDGDPIAIEGIVTDITERKEMENRLSQSLQIIESTTEAIVVTDTRGNIIDINAAYTEITGYTRQELIGRNANIMQSGHHGEEFYEAMWKALTESGRWAGEVWDRRKNGEPFPKWLSIAAIRGSDGQTVNYVGIFSDITQQKRSESELERLAFYDPLTGLPNRYLFQNRMRHEIETAARNGHPIALLFLDLDRFKWVNDTLGHPAGDQLLRVVAKRVKDRLRRSDTVARLGGDEFTIILTGLESIDWIAIIAQELIASIKQPIPLLGREVRVGASIGVAIFPDDGKDLDTLAKHADTAMYQAKESGKDTFRFFSPSMNTKAFNRITLEDELHKALERNELTLYYQPKTSAADNKVVGTEALVRWIKPSTGVVSPADFIPLAEETGLIVYMGRWILDTACRQTAEWNRDSESPLSVAVNLSARQFRDKGLLRTIRKALETSGLAPELLELEITESIVMVDVEEAVQIMKEIRALGITLAIDDFGTGYSSLGYLKRFPITTLKIDKSFIHDLSIDSNDAAIVDAIIAMGMSLGLKVVGEGVETAEQMAFLKERGCHELQGFYLSKPLTAQQLWGFYQDSIAPN